MRFNVFADDSDDDDSLSELEFDISDDIDFLNSAFDVEDDDL